MVFERFTENSIKVFMIAQEESRRLGWNFVGTEQILLGLIQVENGIAPRVLRDLGVRSNAARRLVNETLGAGSGNVEKEIPFTPRAKCVIDLAVKEADKTESSSVYTHHLLLGLIDEGEGVGCEVLKQLGISFLDVRSKVENCPDGFREKPLNDALNWDPVKGVVVILALAALVVVLLLVLETIVRRY